MRERGHAAQTGPSPPLCGDGGEMERKGGGEEVEGAEERGGGYEGNEKTQIQKATRVEETLVGGSRQEDPVFIAGSCRGRWLAGC